MEKNIEHFRDLDAWQVSYQIVLEIYRITRDFPKHELYGLISQLQRASVSVIANIAEGWGRYHFSDKARFYYHARASAYEVECFLLLAKDLQYIDKEKYKELLGLIKRSYQLINGLIRSVKNQK